ncbi:MAG: hypothetical protein ACRDRS_25800 [Pseudonocardiaceae bacterium]
MYELVTDDEVAQQVAALPDELLPYYGQVLDMLKLTAWSGEPYNNAKPDGAMRKLLAIAHGTPTCWAAWRPLPATRSASP